MGIVLKDIYAEAGVRGLFKGVQQRVGYLGLNNAIFFNVYELARGSVTPAPLAAPGRIHTRCGVPASAVRPMFPVLSLAAWHVRSAGRGSATHVPQCCHVPGAGSDASLFGSILAAPAVTPAKGT